MPRLCFGAFAIAVLLASVPLAAENWPHWRGGHGQGVTRETGLPVSWNATTNVAWRAPLQGTGVSSPVVWGDLVFATSQIGTGVRRQGNHPSLVQGAGAGERNLTGAKPGAAGGVTFSVSAYRWSNGSVAWTHELAAVGEMTPVHDKHNLATPSPATDGTVVVAWFGTGQLVALDMAGKPLWSSNLGAQSPFDIQWGHSSSPVIHGDNVLLLCYHSPRSYLIALDKRTGAVKWRHEREAGVLSYSTPIVIATAQGDAVLVNSSTGIEAVRADTGAPLWHVKEDNRFPIPVPALVDGVIYATRGYRSGPYLAIKPGGSGDVTASHVAWRVATGAPYVASLVAYDGLVYSAGELGVVTCLDARTGERVWQERVGGVFTASPIAGDGRIYFVSETGETVVLKAGRTLEVVSRNQLDGHFVASPAVSRGRIFLRADDALYARGR
jgi:outer membrane protein assembly factor BamB